MASESLPSGSGHAPLSVSDASAWPSSPSGVNRSISFSGTRARLSAMSASFLPVRMVPVSRASPTSSASPSARSVSSLQAMRSGCRRAILTPAAVP